MSTRIVLVDDHVLVRSGMKALLDAQPDLEVTGEAGDGAEGVELTLQRRPAPPIARRLVESQLGGAGVRTALKARFDTLTQRERDIVRRLAHGRSNAALAEELALSEATVKTHVTRLLSKLGARSRVQAVVLAYESGFVRPGHTGELEL
jgi:DNA-binding NarL/FixJ family response regulator